MFCDVFEHRLASASLRLASGEELRAGIGPLYPCHPSGALVESALWTPGSHRIMLTAL
jgi:hypothetical protein